MSKADTVDALINSAILNFSRHGYEGASLRLIANQARVPLSTIHAYFGSKADLYSAVEKQVWVEVDSERCAILRRLSSTRSAQIPLLGDLIQALALPIVRRALSECDEEQARIFIICNKIYDRRRSMVSNPFDATGRTMTANWIELIGRACPDLTRQDIIWVFSYVAGVIYSWHLIDHRYDSFLSQRTLRTAEDVTRDIVAFSLAGIHAVVASRADADHQDAGQATEPWFCAATMLHPARSA